MDALYRELDMRYCIELPKGNLAQNIAFIPQQFAPHKLVAGYLLSANKEFHQQTMPVEQALAAIVGRSNTTIISFVPGKVAYFEGHSTGEGYCCIKEAS